MNERIKKLLEQSTKLDCWYKGESVSIVDYKMFAELIVREAAQFVSGSAEVYTQAEQDACVRAAIGLKKYFGVSE